MRNQLCPICESPCVSPSGHSETLLIVGEFPGKAEIENNRPFSTHSMYITAGKVFRKELARVGLDLSQFRVMNLWMHEPNKNEECYKLGYSAVLDEAKNKKAILLVGSEVCEAFTKYKVGDVAGLQVDSPILSCPIIYAMPNPAMVFHKGIGEIRLSIEKFAKRLEQERLV